MSSRKKGKRKHEAGEGYTKSSHTQKLGYSFNNQHTVILTHLLEAHKKLSEEQCEELLSYLQGISRRDLEKAAHHPKKTDTSPDTVYALKEQLEAKLQETDKKSAKSTAKADSKIIQYVEVIRRFLENAQAHRTNSRKKSRNSGKYGKAKGTTVSGRKH
jgi:hypothetical protein